MSLSKKSRYVPPHLRDNNKDIVIANPDDEMGPPQQQYRHSSRHPQSPMQNTMINHAPPNISPSNNAPPHPMHPPPPNLVHPHSNTSPYSPSRRSYTNKTPKSRPIHDNNWRKATPTQQPQLNPQDLLPNDVPQNVQENSNQNETENTPNNDGHYETKPRQYNSRRTRGHNRQRGRGRGRGYYNVNNNNNYGYIEDDPNEIQFAKMEASNDVHCDDNNGPIHDDNTHNPYDSSPFVMESEAPQYKVKYVKKEDRYNRQYVNDNVVDCFNEENVCSNTNQYELSSNFQTLTTKNRQQRRRRNNRQNVITSPPKHVQKSPPTKHIEAATKHRVNNVNAVQLTLPTKRKAAPINWAEKLKAKPRQRSVNDEDTLGLHSSKVRHVLEVLNMTANDYQSVSMVFRYFDIEYRALLSINKRWFVVFDTHKTAINALNIVKHNHFKLRRIDTNIEDVKMLKDNVPFNLK